MNSKERKLAMEMLEHAAEDFSTHGCNDVPELYFRGWTLEERRKFVKEFHDYNGDPEEYDENFLHLQDFCIMSFLAHKLKNDANKLKNTVFQEHDVVVANSKLPTVLTGTPGTVVHIYTEESPYEVEFTLSDGSTFLETVLGSQINKNE